MRFYVSFFLLVFPIFAQTSKIQVIIGSTDNQAPFVFKDGSGLIKDITNAMNNVQNTYNFIFNSYPSKRLRTDIHSGDLHIGAFLNIKWSYDPNLVDSSYNVIHSKDVYITLKTAEKTDAYFNNVGKKLTAGVLGFHYRYANFSTNQDTLKNIYNTITTFSEPNIIKMILKKRAEIGIVSISLLQYLKHTNKIQYDLLLISEEADTKYSRHYLVSKKAPITADKLNEILIELYQSGELKRIYKNYGLECPVLPN